MNARARDFKKTFVLSRFVLSLSNGKPYYLFIMDKKKKIGLIVAGSVELVLVVFCLVVSILVMTNLHTAENMTPDAAHQLNLDQNGPFIGWLQNNPNLFFLIIVAPLLAILVVDVVYIVMYAIKKESNLSDKEKKLLEEQAKKEAKEELRKEIIAELEAE